MKHLFFLFALVLFSASPAFAAEFNGHFGDMDTNQDRVVDWSEFQAYFPHATNEVFSDASQGGEGIDHKAWHAFKQRHGYGHIEGKEHEG